MTTTPAELYDSFSRSITGGWGTSDSGKSWNTSSYKQSTVVPSVSNGVGRMYQKIGSAGVGSIFALNNIPAESEREVLVYVQQNRQTGTSHGPALCITSLGGGEASYYAVRIINNSLQIVVKDRVGGFYVVHQTPFTMFAAETPYWIRFRVTTSGLYVKVWNGNTFEPASWTLQGAPFDGAYPPIAGSAGYIAIGTDVSYEVKIRDFFLYNLNPDTESQALPAISTFNNNLEDTWGLTDRNQMWVGDVSPNPAYRRPATRRSNGANATFIPVNAGVYAAKVGPNKDNLDVTVLFRMQTSSQTLRVGLRGDILEGGTNNTQYKGYFAEIAFGSNQLHLKRVTSFGGAATTLSTTAMSTTVNNAATIYAVRFRTFGTQIRAKLWENANPEPVTWEAATTDGSIASGQSFLVMETSTGGQTFSIHDYKIDVALDEGVTATNQTITDGIDLGSVSDDSLNVTAYIDNDSDENRNGTVTIQYKAHDAVSWETWVASSRSGFGSLFGVLGYRYTITGLDSDTEYTVRVTHSDVDGVIGENPLEGTVKTKNTKVTFGELLTDVDAFEITARLPVEDDSNENSFANARIRPVGGSWPAYALMTPVTENGARYHKMTFSDLEPDTEYEIGVTATDPDGIQGGEPDQTVIRTTIGRAIRVNDVAITASETTAVVNLIYELDTNNNATVAFQYRSIQDRLLTNVPPESVIYDRQNKVARLTLGGLHAHMSYQITAYVSDPDGVEGKSVITSTFTTTGSSPYEDKRGKYHYYRVYDVDGNFVGSWNDAPEPSFSYDQNGGVNDLRVRLPRELTAINRDRTLRIGNRVDVWCVDGESQGMGPNMLSDDDIQDGAWVMAQDWSVNERAGPDKSDAMYFASDSSTARQVLSEPVDIDRIVPVTASMVARARGGKLRMDIAAYDSDGDLLDVSDDNAETIGTEWQRLYVEWLPPASTAYLRIRVENVGAGHMAFDKVYLLVKEMLIYRGSIESVQAVMSDRQEYVELDILGYISQLSDDYIDWLQYVEVQSTEDIIAQRVKRTPTDPSTMMKDIIDIVKKQNPRSVLRYTSDSIRSTNEEPVEYTFKDRQIRDCFEAIRSLCPPSWFYYIEPDGTVHLKGPEHVSTHFLRLNVEVSEARIENTIQELKNVIIFKGRQDEDESEPDSYGSINYTAQDPESIEVYGRRVLKITDAQIRTPDMAEIIAEGRLEEHNSVENSGSLTLPDEKDMRLSLNALRGYNIQAIRPGDMVILKDPTSGRGTSYWDEFIWDEDVWDSSEELVLPPAVPIKSIAYNGTSVIIETSQRPPSARGSFAQMLKKMRKNASNSGF